MSKTKPIVVLLNIMLPTLLIKNIGEEAHIFNMSPEEKLESDKALSLNISEARKRAKRDTCIYCGKQVTSFCNSHSIPRFVLDNIDAAGEVLSHSAILHLPHRL